MSSVANIRGMESANFFGSLYVIGNIHENWRTSDFGDGCNTVDKWMAPPIKAVCFAASVTLTVTLQPEILTLNVTLRTSGQYSR